MFRQFSLAAMIGVVPTIGFADGDFGTKEEARALADAIIEIVDDAGIEAALEALHAPDMPFAGSRMGINVFSGSFVVGDNREPETIAADYSETADLTGALVWPIIAAAAEVEGDAELKWYHYDTPEAYDYKCHAKKSAIMDVFVMVCR